MSIYTKYMYIESGCARVCVHTYMCIYINDTYTSKICVYVWVYIHMTLRYVLSSLSRAHLCINIYIYKYVYTHSFCACVHVCVYIYMYIFTYTCVRIAEERDHPREKDREGTRKKRSFMCSSVLRIGLFWLRIGLFCSWICFARRAILLVGRFFKRV